MIDNMLPSAPITFLRSGYALFINQPTTRTHKLTNNFNLFAALKENKTEGDIMGIKDYENET
jgi:hypothetical protein